MCVVFMHKCLQVPLFTPGVSAAPIGTLTVAVWCHTQTFVVKLMKSYMLSVFLELSPQLPQPF